MTIIIGANSNLSKVLIASIPNVIVISTTNIATELEKLHFNKNEKINIIFNQFQKSTKLKTLDDPIDYINRSISSTGIALDFIEKYSLNIKKIIYSSSSSVYGKNSECKESSLLTPLSLEASLKLSNELLIKRFCENYSIDYTITRIFNMYGNEDEFSIISKIINTYKKNKVLTLINNGGAIRDYIHIDDVVFIYKILLNTTGINVLNIGTGKGVSVFNILKLLKKNGILIDTKVINKEELKVSIANIEELQKLIENYKFKEVDDFIISQLK